MNASDFTKYLQRMLAITDTGLTFTKDPFDRERYEDLRILLSEMLNQVSDLDAEEVAEVMKPTSAYATPLMDVRAWIVEDEKVCLVRGKGEDSWALAILQPKIFLKKLKKKPALQQKLKGYLQFLIPIVSNYRANNMQSLSLNVNFLTDNFKKIKKLLTFNFLPLTNCQSYLKNASPRSKWRFFGKYIKDKETNILTEKIIIVFLNSFFSIGMV